MPNATATMANPIKTMEAQTVKAVSDESGRSCIAMGGYETVDENRVMLSPNLFFEHDYVDGQGSKVRTKPRCQSEHFSCCPLPKFIRRQFPAGRLPSSARTRQAAPAAAPAHWGMSGLADGPFQRGPMTRSACRALMFGCHTNSVSRAAATGALLPLCFVAITPFATLAARSTLAIPTCPRGRRARERCSTIVWVAGFR
jgi:hypothetical protein